MRHTQLSGERKRKSDQKEELSPLRFFLGAAAQNQSHSWSTVGGAPGAVGASATGNDLDHFLH